MCARQRIKISSTIIIYTTMGRATEFFLYYSTRNVVGPAASAAVEWRYRRTSRRRRGRRVTVVVVARGRAAVDRRQSTTTPTVCQCVRAIQTRSNGVASVEYIEYIVVVHYYNACARVRPHNITVYLYYNNIIPSFIFRDRVFVSSYFGVFTATK